MMVKVILRRTQAVSGDATHTYIQIKMSIALSPLTAISISQPYKFFEQTMLIIIFYFSTIVNYICEHRLGTFNMRKKGMNKTRKLDQSFVTLSI